MAEVAPVAIESSTAAAMPDSRQERRSAQRFECKGTAQLIVLGGALRFSGRVEDLSTNGCRLVTEAPFTLERGTVVEITMEVNGMSFRVTGGVRAHQKGRGVGLAFVNLSSRSASYIGDLIAEIQARAARETAP